MGVRLAPACLKGLGQTAPNGVFRVASIERPLEIRTIFFATGA